MPAKTAASRTVLEEAPEDAPMEDVPAPLAEFIPVGDLRPHVKNVRQQLGDLTELTRSVKAQGILQPLVVAPHPSEAYAYVIIAGHRRHAAAEAARLAAVPCVVRRDLKTDADVIVAMLTENLHRADLTPIEEATAYEQLELAGMTVAKIAKAVGRSADTIRSRKHLMDLPEEARDRLQARTMTLDQAEALLEFTDRPDLLRKLEQELDQPGGGNFRYELARAREAVERAAVRQKTVDVLRGAGFNVVDDIPWTQRTGYLFQIGGGAGDNDNRAVYNPEAVDAHAATGCTETMLASATLGGWIELGCAHPMHQAGADARDGGDEQLDIGNGPASARDEQTRAQERAAEEQLVADHRAAARLRREHVSELLNGYRLFTPEMAAAVAHFVARRALVDDETIYPDPEILARLIGADELADDFEAAVASRDFDLQRGLREELAESFPRHLPDQRAFLAVVAASEEDGLSNPVMWSPMKLNSPYGDGRRGWLQVLGGPLGYEWSPVEEAALNAADAAEAERLADQREDAQGDDEETDERPVEVVPTGDAL